MAKLIKYLKDYKKESIIGPLFKLIEAIFELIVPVVMAKIIDVGIANGDKAYIWKSGAVLVFLGILGLSCSLTAQYFAAKASFGFGTAIRRDLFKHINKLSYSEIDNAGTSTLINRITTDVNLAQSAVNMFLRIFLRAPFIVLGAIIMAFTIDAKLTLIFLVASPVLAFVIYLIMSKTMPEYKGIQKELDGITLSVRENLAGARVIRAFSSEDREEAEFRKKAEDLKKRQVIVGRLSAFLNPLTYVIVYIAIILIVWFGGGAVNIGRIKQGELIALVSYMTQILFAMIAFAQLIIIVTRGTASAARVSEMFDVKSTVSDDGNKTCTGVEGEAVVEFSNVSFSYIGSDETSLCDISFRLEHGQTMGIIGGTGSGKTTLINLIPRFYEAAEGSVKVNGVDVRNYPFEQLREKIGMVPQKAVLFSGTIRDNMKWGKTDASNDEIMQALKTAQAAEFVMAKPNGLNEMIEQGGRNLSGGQRQRLTIARAVVRKPEILILDDSASALDLATDAALRHSLSQDKCADCVIIVSQRASSIKNADFILVLDDGKIVGKGTHDELLKTCEVYHEICMSQLSAEEIKGGAI